MTTKVAEKTNSIGLPVINPDADVHHMIRHIGEQNTPEGAISADNADQAVRNWLQAGYRLAFAEKIAEEVRGVRTVGILYIFVKDA